MLAIFELFSRLVNFAAHVTGEKLHQAKHFDYFDLSDRFTLAAGHT